MLKIVLISASTWEQPKGRTGREEGVFWRIPSSQRKDILCLQTSTISTTKAKKIIVDKGFLSIYQNLSPSFPYIN